MQQVITVLEQRGRVQEVSPGAGVEVVIGEAGGCERFPDAAEVERGTALGKRGVELKAENDEDEGGVVTGAPDDAVTSCSSCDSWTLQGC